MIKRDVDNIVEVLSLCKGKSVSLNIPHWKSICYPLYTKLSSQNKSVYLISETPPKTEEVEWIYSGSPLLLPFEYTSLVSTENNGYVSLEWVSHTHFILESYFAELHNQSKNSVSSVIKSLSRAMIADVYFIQLLDMELSPSQFLTKWHFLRDDDYSSVIGIDTHNKNKYLQVYFIVFQLWLSRLIAVADKEMYIVLDIDFSAMSSDFWKALYIKTSHLGISLIHPELCSAVTELRPPVVYEGQSSVPKKWYSFGGR